MIYSTSIRLKKRVSPDHVLDIRLCRKTWQKILYIAAKKKCSYSHVVRYCVFRLIRRNDFTGISKRSKRYYHSLERLARKKQTATQFHRHRLCLYGDDELFIRMVAARTGCTMTHLVRLALEWHLENLKRIGIERGGFHALAFYWLGIKIHMGVDFHTHGSGTRLFLERLPETAYR